MSNPIKPSAKISVPEDFVFGEVSPVPKAPVGPARRRSRLPPLFRLQVLGHWSRLSESGTAAASIRFSGLTTASHRRRSLLPFPLALPPPPTTSLN